MKKLASLLLALVMILSCTFAMAEDTYTTTATPANTTISVADTDSHTYSVYQIFTGILSNDGTKLSNIKWGKNGTGTEGELVPEGTINDLEEVNSIESNLDKLDVIKQYVNLKNPIGTVDNTNELTVPTGYYLFVDEGELVVDEENLRTETYSLYVVQVAGATEVSPKRGTVESQKKVKDINDSASHDESDWQDSADYDIGDNVPFQLTGKVDSNYDNYETYYFAFHDKQSAGLKFNESSVVVKANGTELVKDTDYTISTACTDGCTFEIIFSDMKQIETTAITAGATITVDYTAELTEGAVIGSKGNPNTMHIEFSNNPNTNDKGETPDDTVIVFTYKVVANKTDGTNPLAGAGFTLYKKDSATGEYKAIGTEIKAADGETMTTFEWKGIDDGEYKLVESTTPDGYNTAADVYFTVEANHVTLSPNPTLESLTGGNVVTGEASTGALTTTVVNKAGATLPETGGMGTTLLYVGGGILVLAAIVMLIVKRRVNAD